jgi:hypothetical protein
MGTVPNCLSFLWPVYQRPVRRLAREALRHPPALRATLNHSGKHMFDATRCRSEQRRGSLQRIALTHH